MLVTDGAAAGSFADIHRLNGTGVQTPSAWLMFQTIRVPSATVPARRSRTRSLGSTRRC